MTASSHAIETVQLAAQAAATKLATNQVAFDVSEQIALTDVFLIVTAANDRQVGAVAQAIEEALAKAGEKPIGREGERENRWVLLDYVDVVVHVQQPEERSIYALERLWKDCPTVDLPGLDTPVVAAQ